MSHYCFLLSKKTGTNRTDYEEESFNSNVVDSPGGKTKLWKPIVPKEFMPDVDATYQSLEEAVEMYKLYADKAGFGVRSADTSDPEGSGRNKRNSNFKITDCKALIKFERRKMGNIIGDKDAQLVVDKMNMRKDELHNYTFEYKCVDSVLNAMFWADETNKLYYKEFGDVISFDATFRTNKYGMIFVPFTAIDNHKRSINIGAVWYYSIDSDEKIDGWQVVMITQMDKSKQLKIKCKVELKLLEKEVKCSCNHFIRTVILCRHIFVVLKNNHVEEIPEQYILRRWRRDAISSHLLAMKHVDMETEDDTFKLLTEAYNNVEYCLDHFKRSKEKLLEFVEKTR
ncbi:unnamed protein product [Lactuca saligna]|uniref:SWIM-type domain-containing protein n=1 Tax=Lactuca saligna TaxID=75948 RepID=A0AA35ZKA2_LACSI|nr:unnamed protein product [Lactuca saligna]